MVPEQSKSVRWRRPAYALAWALIAALWLAATLALWVAELLLHEAYEVGLLGEMSDAGTLNWPLRLTLWLFYTHGDLPHTFNLAALCVNLCVARLWKPGAFLFLLVLQMLCWACVALVALMLVLEPYETLTTVIEKAPVEDLPFVASGLPGAIVLLGSLGTVAIRVVMKKMSNSRRPHFPEEPRR